jgi:hypothetical protein
MFSGVSLNAVCDARRYETHRREADDVVKGMAQLWGATGGKIFTKTFKYAIGGEW